MDTCRDTAGGTRDCFSLETVRALLQSGQDGIAQCIERAMTVLSPLGGGDSGAF